jgi:hypothetical protein
VSAASLGNTIAREGAKYDVAAGESQPPDTGTKSKEEELATDRKSAFNHKRRDNSKSKT